jgi:hypothetical protein
MSIQTRARFSDRFSQLVVGDRVLQLGDRGDDAVGQLGAQQANDLLGRVALRAGWGQREHDEVLQQEDPPAAS